MEQNAREAREKRGEEQQRVAAAKVAQEATEEIARAQADTAAKA